MSKKEDKTRIDMLLLHRGMVPSRQRARALIMAGKVLVNSIPVDKPGTQVSSEARLSLRGEDLAYVSRGGLKLEAALDSFGLDVTDQVCLDVGASTGGFTDCLLKRGARKVIAVDVGYGQMDWGLRQDPRVVLLERTNIRHLSSDAVPGPMDLITIDVSFISLRIVVPAASRFLKTGGRIVALIKPQFEVGKGLVGKGGVVRDASLHDAVLAQLTDFFEASGFFREGLIESPITGPKGNREFLICLKMAGVSPH